jgi:predicted enzyme related to lactoylglutathione lyase
MGERTRYAPGMFCWVGLATSDPRAATAFYTSLFGWQGEDLPAGEADRYTILRHAGRDVAILYRQTTEARAAGAPPHWTSFISVEDADTTAARAGELGGAAVFREPFDVLDAGRVAAVRDPTGAIVSLWQPLSRIGATLATYVSMTAAGHDPQFSSYCGPELVQRFISTRAVGDTSCADEPAAGWWVPGRFPTRVDDAPAAAQSDGPQAPKRLRRLATVAAWTVMDSVQHNFLVPDSHSVGLRGGTVDFEEIEGGAQWMLDLARFTRDVAVSGAATDVDRLFDGEFTVNGPGGEARTMQIGGDFLTDGADITITFDVAGRPATFTVPAY